MRADRDCHGNTVLTDSLWQGSSVTMATPYRITSNCYFYVFIILIRGWGTWPAIKDRHYAHV